MSEHSDNETRSVVEMLEVLKPVAARDSGSEQRGRQQFLTQAKILRLQTVSKIEKPRHIVSNNIFKFRKDKFAMQLLTSAIIIFALLFGGAGGTVYAAQSSMPDDTLYPVKLWSEDVRLGLNGDVDQQLSLLGEFTNRRILEIQNSYTQGEPPTQAVLDRLQTQTRQCLQLATNLPDDSIVPALIQIRDRLMEQDRVMEQLHQQDQANESMTQVMNQLREQLRVVEDGVVNPVQYRNRLNNPNENMTGNTPDQKSTATETPSNDVTIVPGNSNVNHNQHQQRYQYTMTPQVTKVITATATIEELGVDPKTTVGSNGNQYGDGDCTGSNCQGTGDCDGTGIGDQDGTNCQGTGDCDGTGIGDQDGTNCQGSGDCDGTGNDSNTSGSQQNQSVKTEGSTTETQSVSNPHNDNGSSNGNGN